MLTNVNSVGPSANQQCKTRRAARRNVCAASWATLRDSEFVQYVDVVACFCITMTCQSVIHCAISRSPLSKTRKSRMPSCACAPAEQLGMSNRANISRVRTHAVGFLNKILVDITYDKSFVGSIASC